MWFIMHSGRGVCLGLEHCIGRLVYHGAGRQHRGQGLALERRFGDLLHLQSFFYLYLGVAYNLQN